MSYIRNTLHEDYLELLYEFILSGTEKEGDWFLLQHSPLLKSNMYAKVHSLKDKKYTILIKAGDTGYIDITGCQVLTHYKNNLKHGKEYEWYHYRNGRKTKEELTWDNGKLINTKKIYDRGNDEHNT